MNVLHFWEEICGSIHNKCTTARKPQMGIFFMSFQWESMNPEVHMHMVFTFFPRSILKEFVAFLVLPTYPYPPPLWPSLLRRTMTSTRMEGRRCTSTSRTTPPCGISITGGRAPPLTRSIRSPAGKSIPSSLAIEGVHLVTGDIGLTLPLGVSIGGPD